MNEDESYYGSAKARRYSCVEGVCWWLGLADCD